MKALLITMLLNFFVFTGWGQDKEVLIFTSNLQTDVVIELFFDSNGKYISLGRVVLNKGTPHHLTISRWSRYKYSYKVIGRNTRYSITSQRTHVF